MWFRMFYYDLYLHFIHIVQNQYIKDVLFHLKKNVQNHMEITSALSLRLNIKLHTTNVASLCLHTCSYLLWVEPDH